MPRSTTAVTTRNALPAALAGPDRVGPASAWAADIAGSFPGRNAQGRATPVALATLLACRADPSPWSWHASGTRPGWADRPSPPGISAPSPPGHNPRTSPGLGELRDCRSLWAGESREREGS